MHYLSGFKIQTYDSTFRAEYLLRKNKNTAHQKQNQRKPKEKKERSLTIYSTTSVQFSSSVMFNSCEPMNGSTQGLLVHHQPGVHTYSCLLSW